MEEKASKPRVRAVPWTTPTEEKVKGALGELPAYVRRARRLEETVARLWAEAAAAREEMLLFVFLRLRRVLELGAAAGPAIDAIREEAERFPTFRALRPRPPTRARKREPERALAALADSVTRFNARWRKWIDDDAPLVAVNAEIEGYNRHYEFERQCALKYVPLDKVPFRKRAPLTADDVLEALPFLPAPPATSA